MLKRRRRGTVRAGSRTPTSSTIKKVAASQDELDKLIHNIKAEQCKVAQKEGDIVSNLIRIGALLIELQSADEGHYATSGGIQVREGYPHIVVYGEHLGLLENALAHEMTHAGLHHLSMPQWLEKGLAQMAEHEITGRELLIVNGELAGRHKRFWGKHGLDAFWSGEGFSRPGKMQALSYQLAEILVRLLFEDARPRWFGWVQEARRRLFAFLRTAANADKGESACREFLGMGRSELAARFLGPGSWAPSS